MKESVWDYYQKRKEWTISETIKKKIRSKLNETERVSNK